VHVIVSQSAAQSSNGLGALGSGLITANCDGSPHKLNVTVVRTISGLFSIGQADASASLNNGAATDQRTIDIVHP
jgi:hypothetical protein